jgi:putative hydroxymethylpyrimidine transporter CytX
MEHGMTGGRHMSSLAVGLMWAGIAISVAEIWAGSLLGEAGLFWGVVIILVGHLLGGIVLSAAGCIGTRYGAMAMQSTRLVLGNRGSVLPSLLNVVQLVGWATYMLALSGDIGAAVGAGTGGLVASRYFWIVLIGAGTLAWSFLVGTRKLQWIHTLVLVALLALTLLLSWVVLSPQHYRPQGSLLKPLSLARGMLLLDLVIAMPISWVPLIADYSRLARSEKGAFWGSFIGYGLFSSWMYIIGLVICLATGSNDPATNVLALMGSIGLAIPAMVLVFASTVTSDFPDIYSCACSLLNVDRRLKPRVTMWVTGLLTIVLAMLLDRSTYESFLILIGTVFVPLFALVVVDYFILRRQRLEGVDFEAGTGLVYSRGFRLSGLAVWVLGSVVFQWAQRTQFVLGGSITSFVATVVLYLALETTRRRRGAWRMSTGQSAC